MPKHTKNENKRISLEIILQTSLNVHEQNQNHNEKSRFSAIY